MESIDQRRYDKLITIKISMKFTKLKFFKYNINKSMCFFFSFLIVPYAKSALILILMSIPGQIMFIFVADYIHMEKSTIGPVFVCSYLFVSLLQVSINETYKNR